MDHFLATTFLLIAHALMGAFFPSIRVNAIDLTPNFAGTLISITNGLGSLTGFVAAYSAGVLTPNVNMSFKLCPYLTLTNQKYFTEKGFIRRVEARVLDLVCAIRGFIINLLLLGFG